MPNNKIPTKLPTSLTYSFTIVLKIKIVSYYHINSQSEFYDHSHRRLNLNYTDRYIGNSLQDS